MLPGPLSSYRCVQSIQREHLWRRLPGLDPAQGPPRGLFASHWVDSSRGTVEANAHTGYHVISVALRPTSLALSVDGHLIHDGRIAAGMIQVSDPDTAFGVHFHAPNEFLHLHVSAGLLQEYADETTTAASSRYMRCGTSGFVRDPTIKNLARAVLCADAIGGSHEQLFADSIGMALVARLTGTHTSAGAKVVKKTPAELPEWRMRKVEDYIQAHLGERISLADLASAAGLSRMHFAAQFRAATGLRPHEYLLHKKIERAQRLLAQEDLSLVDVAFSLGFQTQAHFTTVFKRFVGETPNRWRQAGAASGASTRTRTWVRGFTNKFCWMS